MDKQSLKKSFNSFLEYMDDSTIPGYFRETKRSSLLASQINTRSNSAWKKSEYIIAFLDDDTDNELQLYIKGWKKLTREDKKNNQFLLLEISKGVWKMYDNIGEEILANNDEIEQFILNQQNTDNDVDRLENGIQKIFYGAPGTGKSHKVKGLVEGKKERTERITFHPEYDYSSFVGGYKPTMGKDEDGKEVIKYEFVPQAFTNIYVKAWNSLAVGKKEGFYLLIEEINRGNCAEIFGDIFQLLDRDSDYDITPSKELKFFLEYNKNGLVDKSFGLKNGKLLLPPNLNILATMNTSDQSLFPMDSAFKRRWDWEYIPIIYSRKENENSSAKFVVKLSNNESFKWLDFIEKVNEKISQNDNLGMDKCLGNYFIKPENNEIEIETFINKAIFYLWNDVFKDEIEEDSIFKNKTTYEKFFPIDDEHGKQKVKDILEDLGIDYKSSI